VPESAAGRREQIVAVALELLEERGPEALSMRTIAERIGIRAPSLYKHFPDKDALETAVVAAGFASLAEAFAERPDVPDDASTDPLTTLAASYRHWAREHRHLYRLMTHKAIRRDLLPPGVEQAAAAPVVAAAAGDGDLARALWAFAHGMTSLELADRFPPDADLDAAWHAGLEGLRLRIEAVRQAGR
jgi:AcrR family transcriptional regulator